MSPIPDRAARPLAAVSALALGLLVALPVFAQPAAIDFGSASGEDRLLGAPSAPTGWRDAGAARETTHRSPQASRGHRDARPSPSVVFVSANRREPAFIRGTGIFANARGGSGSVVVLPRYAAPATAGDGPSTGGPRFINVERERLDRQAIAPAGISIHRVGSAKIIRIAAVEAPRPAAEKDMAPLPAARSAPAVIPRDAPRDEAPRDAAPAERSSPPRPPVPAPAERAASEPTPLLEPWTDEWLADCVARHESFDASLGTYLDEDGRRRFCTGGPA